MRLSIAIVSFGLATSGIAAADDGAGSGSAMPPAPV